MRWAPLRFTEITRTGQLLFSGYRSCTRQSVSEWLADVRWWELWPDMVWFAWVLRFGLDHLRAWYVYTSYTGGLTRLNSVILIIHTFISNYCIKLNIYEFWTNPSWRKPTLLLYKEQLPTNENTSNLPSWYNECVTFYWSLRDHEKGKYSLLSELAIAVNCSVCALQWNNHISESVRRNAAVVKNFYFALYITNTKRTAAAGDLLTWRWLKRRGRNVVARSFSKTTTG